MEIQWSLVLFTALSGAGAWLVACAGLDAFKGLAKKTVVPAVVTGIVLIIVGGIASATHLSHVVASWPCWRTRLRAFSWEAVLLGIDVVLPSRSSCCIGAAPPKGCSRASVSSPWPWPPSSVMRAVPPT